MKGPRARFALALALLWLAVAGTMGATGFMLWSSLDPAERAPLGAALAAHAPLLVLAAIVLALVLAALLNHWFAAYPQAASRLAQEVRDLYTVHAERRIEPAGGPELRQLASAINSFALVHQTLRQGVDARVAESNARLAQQKNRLAALMAQLAQSVIVCNAEGRILLYNERATELLAGEGAPVGLGRSIFGVLDRSLVVHALDRIRHRLAHDGAGAVAQFVTTRGGALLRCQMAPVLDEGGRIGGYVLVLADITRTVEAESRRDVLLQQLTEHTRASLAGIRAAVETMQQYPRMDEARRARFVEVIREEAHKLSGRLHETLARHPDTLRAQWALEDMLAADLLVALQRSVQATLGVEVTRVEAAPGLWLSVDSYALVQGLTHVVAQLAERFGVRELSVQASAEGRLARLTLAWAGAGPDAPLLHEWEEQPFSPVGTTPTLRAVLERHGGELWCRSGPEGGQRLCIELPVTEAERVAPPGEALPSRPVYYDFDLFSQPGQTPELDERPLAELAYTVFDTETTGLDPSQGDEIISIGAVRIVNGRLLENECFDQLVNPRRAVRRESQEVHGLTDAVLAGQPTIDEVLPRFHRFCEDTVLVAHNAAFDMRFLQLKEGATGVRFIQPVLDTLLLSALTHPGRSDPEHRLEAIAARLGVPVVGRHTALGDAMVTGEVFLRLVPLLAERGIHTLRHAREASQRTLYAKLEY